MASNVEVEIKFVIDDIRLLTTRLRQAEFRLITPRAHESNTLYDLPGNPLRKRGALLRLREYDGRWTVTFKGKARVGRYKSREEIETRVEDGKSFSAILEAVGFKPTFSYEKFRSEWSDGSGHVVLDETPVGNFGEIEGSRKWIDSVASRLHITPAQYITDSYATLFLKWKRRTRSRAKNMVFAEVRGAGKRPFLPRSTQRKSE
jgi:adenylate cyclase, class 2